MCVVQDSPPVVVAGARLEAASRRLRAEAPSRMATSASREVSASSTARTQSQPTSPRSAQASLLLSDACCSTREERARPHRLACLGREGLAVDPCWLLLVSSRQGADGQARITSAQRSSIWVSRSSRRPTWAPAAITTA